MYRNGYNVYSNFDYMISRSVYPDSYGYYNFYFWFYSQSYYWDGRNPIYTSTNVRNITVHVYDITGEKLDIRDLYFRSNGRKAIWALDNLKVKL